MSSSHSTDAPARPDQESVRLESWKEIAAYLNRSVTTVQRWEQEEGLPIHRLIHAKGGSVYALTHELDAWRRHRDSLGNSERVALGEGEIPNLDAEAIPSAHTPTPEFRADQQKGRFLAAVGSRPWRVAVLALAAVAALGALFSWRAGSPRITSVRTLVSDLERFGGLLRTSDACENPYATWSWASDDERVYLARTQYGRAALVVGRLEISGQDRAVTGRRTDVISFMTARNLVPSGRICSPNVSRSGMMFEPGLPSASPSAH